jgi:hypothetical protein
VVLFLRFYAEKVVRLLIPLVASLAWTLALPPVQADSFVINGNDLDWASPSGGSLAYLVGIENPGRIPDLLLMWELNLTVSPATTATTGNLSIAGFREPSQDYLLEGHDHSISSLFIGPGNTIDNIGDQDQSLVGVSVPEMGKYLLELELTATSDAEGTFAVTVIPNEISSFWAGLDDAGDLVMHPFDNLPFGSGPITIGTVTIQQVPEPATMAILSSGLGFLGAWCLRRKYVGRSALNQPEARTPFN